MYHDKEDWQIFENTHEAIIDEETFKIVQNIRKGRRRRTDMGDMPMLSGMLYLMYFQMCHAVGRYP